MKIKLYVLILIILKNFLILKEKNQRLVFSGSTIGNFTPDDAKNLLLKFSNILGENNYLVIGVDLKEDIKVMNKLIMILMELRLNLIKIF